MENDFFEKNLLNQLKESIKRELNPKVKHYIKVINDVTVGKVNEITSMLNDLIYANEKLKNAHRESIDISYIMDLTKNDLAYRVESANQALKNNQTKLTNINHDETISSLSNTPLSHSFKKEGFNAEREKIQAFIKEDKVLLDLYSNLLDRGDKLLDPRYQKIFQNKGDTNVNKATDQLSKEMTTAANVIKKVVMTTDTVTANSTNAVQHPLIPDPVIGGLRQPQSLGSLYSSGMGSSSLGFNYGNDPYASTGEGSPASNFIDDCNRLDQISLDNAKNTLAEFTAATEGRFNALHEVVSVFGSELGSAVASAFEEDNFDWGSFLSSLGKTIKAMAISKTLSLTIEGIYQQVMASYYQTLATTVPITDPMKSFYQKAAIGAQIASSGAFAGAAMFGAMSAGSILGGMAHSGIESIPEEGTWLLDKGERVVDAKTNKDLKGYLRDGGRGDINMTVNINNSDEKGVMNALPKLKQTIIDVINQDITHNGITRKTIKAYA